MTKGGLLLKKKKKKKKQKRMTEGGLFRTATYIGRIC
jgi:hypothetical protein